MEEINVHLCNSQHYWRCKFAHLYCLSGHFTFSPTGFRLIPDPVSHYGVSRYRALYCIQAFSSGIAGAGLLLIITRSGTVMPVFGIITLLCFTLSLMVIIAFPTGLKLPRARTGMIHILLATLTFAGIACAAGSL
jgi:hypothetical protein